MVDIVSIIYILLVYVVLSMFRVLSYYFFFAKSIEPVLWYCSSEHWATNPCAGLNNLCIGLTWWYRGFGISGAAVAESWGKPRRKQLLLTIYAANSPLCSISLSEREAKFYLCSIMRWTADVEQAPRSDQDTKVLGYLIHRFNIMI